MFVFNFLASSIGGGYKRLHSFCNYFNKIEKESLFIVHHSLSHLKKEFPQNEYIFVNRSNISRLFYEKGIIQQLIKPLPSIDFYYSYGIPIYDRYGSHNWFHVSNVLPILYKNIDLNLFQTMKMGILNSRIINYLNIPDTISAESDFSLSLLPDIFSKKFFKSVNGSDDEINYYKTEDTNIFEDYAVAVGTYSYKNLDLVIRIFDQVKQELGLKKLFIIGNKKFVTKKIRPSSEVYFLGEMERELVIKYLSKSSLYISATSLENSYNAASEGLLLARQSIISSIKPHIELLNDIPHKEFFINFGNQELRFMFLPKPKISLLNLKTWDTVIEEMLAKINI